MSWNLRHNKPVLDVHLYRQCGAIMAVVNVSATVVFCSKTLLETLGLPPSCTQFGFQEDGAPAGQPSISSRMVTPEWGLVSSLLLLHACCLWSLLKSHTQRQCGYRFPGAFGSNAAIASPNSTGINAAYDGWNTTVENIVFAGGTRESPIFRPLSWPAQSHPRERH